MIRRLVYSFLLVLLGFPGSIALDGTRDVAWNKWLSGVSAAPDRDCIRGVYDLLTALSYLGRTRFVRNAVTRKLYFSRASSGVLIPAW